MITIQNIVKYYKLAGLLFVLYAIGYTVTNTLVLGGMDVWRASLAALCVILLISIIVLLLVLTSVAGSVSKAKRSDGYSSIIIH